jgi:hypothetical protein
MFSHVSCQRDYKAKAILKTVQVSELQGFLLIKLREVKKQPRHGLDHAGVRTLSGQCSEQDLRWIGRTVRTAQVGKAGVVRFDSGGQFDVTPDGETFLINSWMEEQTPRAMSVVLNWAP